MESLSHLCDGFIQNDGVPDGVLDALRKFVTSEPRQIIEPVQTCQHEEVERKALCGRVMQALVDAKPTMDMTMTSVLWSLFITAPMEQLRLLESENTQPVVVDFLEMTRTRLGILLKTFLAKESAISDPLPRSSRYETGVEKCLRRDGGCCTITGSATPHVCHIIPLSVTKRKRFTTEAIRVIIGTYWGEARNRRLQDLLSDNAEIYSARNAICLSPLLHHWWGLGYIALEPLEKLPNGTRVRLRWLRRTSFSVWDKVPLDTNPNDYLHPPLVAGSFSIRDLRSGHSILDGSTFDLTSDDPLTEVSYDLLELQWDLLCMAVLCGAAEAADDPSWNPVDEDPVYSAEKLMRELELEEGGGSVELRAPLLGRSSGKAELRPAQGGGTGRRQSGLSVPQREAAVLAGGYDHDSRDLGGNSHSEQAGYDGRYPILSGVVNDARRFVLSNKTAIERAPLQLYSSALIFSPSKCKVCSLFRHLIPSWITQVPEPEEDWTPDLYALGENGGVLSVAFSPVDDLLVSGCLGNTAIIWDYVTATELYTFLEPDIVLSVAFSPDGKTVACGLRNGVIRIREFAKGRSIDLIGHTNPVYSVAFSPKSSSTLTSVSADKTLRVWNIEKERAAHILDISRQYAPLVRKGPSLDVEFPPGGLAFSPRGDFVAVGSNAGSQGSVTLWGVEKGELRTTFEGHDSFVPSVAISADGETVISGSADRTVKVWNATTGQIRHETRYATTVQHVRFCPPNGEHVIVADSEVVEIRRADTWDLVGNFNGRSSADLALSRDGHFLATASMGSDISLRDMRDNTWKVSSGVQRKGTTHFIQFFPGEDNDVMTVSDHMVRFWDANNALIKSTPGFLRELSFSADRRFVGLEMFTPTVQIWSQGMARKIASYDDTYRMKLSPAGGYVAIRSLRKTRIIDLTTLEETAVLDSDLKLSYPIAFSPDGRVLAWINNSERICFLDLTAGEELVGPACVSVDYITFSPDGEPVALSGDDRMRAKSRGSVRKNREISLIEVATGKERAVFAAAYWELVTFHPAGHLMAAGESDISAWNTASGDVIRTFKLDPLTPGRLHALAISLAGDLVVAAGATRDPRGAAVQLWDFATGTAIGILHISTSLRQHLAFSSDCRYLETRRGRVPLPPPIIGQAAALDDASLETAESCLYVPNVWVAQGFDSLLWIPEGFQHVNPAVKGNTVAFGRAGGKVTYLRFDLSKTPRSTRAKGFRRPR